MTARKPGFAEASDPHAIIVQYKQYAIILVAAYARKSGAIGHFLYQVEPYNKRARYRPV